MDPRLLQNLIDAAQLRTLRLALRGVHHELRGLLNEIALSVGVARAELSAGGDPAEVRARLAGIEPIVDRLGTGLHAVGRLTASLAPSEEAFDVSDVVDAVGEVLRSTAARQRVAFCVERFSFRVRGSRRLLEFILLQLGVNALEAMSGGGRLEVRCERDGTRLRIRVADTGSGLAGTPQDGAWPLFRSKKRQGRGVGLFVVRHLASEMDGEIDFEPTDGGGCTAILTLPAAPENGTS
jgi:signal transduction histidine kinase